MQAQTLHNLTAAAVNLLQRGVQHLREQKYELALQDSQQALTIFKQVKYHKFEWLALGVLGDVYTAQKDYEQAGKLYEQSLSVIQEIQDKKGEKIILDKLFITYRDKGIKFLKNGNYGNAIDSFQKGLLISRKVWNEKGEAIILNDLLVIYKDIGNYNEAIKVGEKALVITYKIKDRQLEAYILENLGSVVFAMGNHDLAIKLHLNSLSIKEEFRDLRGELHTLGNLGLIYTVLGDYEQAIQFHLKALGIAQKIKDFLAEGKILGHLGNIYLSQGNYIEAIDFYQKSLAIKQIRNDYYGQGSSLSNMGIALFYVGDYVQAERTLYEGIQVWESLRGSLGEKDSNKISFFETQSSPYIYLQKVLIVQNKVKPALEISERGRARAFVELLASRLTTDKSNKQTIDPISSLSDLSVSEPVAKPPSLQKIQQIARAQNATLVQYSIIYDDFKIQNKHEVRASELYIWIIHPNGNIDFHAVDLKPLEQQKIILADLVSQSRKGIGVIDRSEPANIKIALTPEAQQQLQENQTRNLRQLYQLLIEPIADLLPKNERDRVIFLPQGALFLVPFPALLNAQNQPLITQHTILTAPSIQTLDLTHKTAQSHSKTNRPALVVGNPTMPAVTTVIGEPPQKLAPLQGAEQEAIAIAEELKTQAIIGANAKKEVVVQKMQNAGIIHLATHGLLDSFKGDTPGAIALAPNGNGDRNDGLLTSGEIFDLKLNADLVVLSACDTGRGEITGDGVIGLSRSLFVAGVPSVIVSLWKVPDEATAFLMTEFYKNWRDRKLDKAQALRQAMLTTRKKHPQPLDWAAFTLIGEAE
jgi:CHAT domain-containing protein/tetratricopeptide (TPR) repeat protein